MCDIKDNWETCKDSKKRPAKNFGKESLQVYSSCRHPSKINSYRTAVLEHRSVCDRCDFYKRG